MALRGTLTHRKTRRLAQLLGIDLCFAMGLLEALWHVTGEQAPNGAIGRMSDQDIAMEMFYGGDPKVLIDSLVTAVLIDRNETHRLIVHDWHIHSDDATDNKLTRAAMRYANGELPRMRRLSKVDRAHASAQYATPCAQKRTESHEMPLPEPVPVPVPEPVKKDKVPSRDKREVDSRHVVFKSEIERYMAQKQVLFIWDASEAKALDLLLKATPGLTIADFQRCLFHRARSPGTPHGDRPRVWLPNILKYQEAPLNEFGKTGAANGNGKASQSTNRAIERQQISHDAIRAAVERRLGTQVSGVDGPDAGLLP